MIVYLLIISHWNYGLIFDHNEIFKTKPMCIERANNLPKGYFPYFNDKNQIDCIRMKVIER